VEQDDDASKQMKRTKVEFCVGDLVEAKAPDEESSGIGEVVNLLPNDRVMVAFEIEGEKMISVFEDNQLEHVRESYFGFELEDSVEPIAMQRTLLSKNDLKKFHEDGIIVLEDVLSSEEMKAMRKEIEKYFESGHFEGYEDQAHVRNDKIVWVDCFTENNDEMQKELPKVTAFTKIFHGVASELKKELVVKMRVPSRCMLACYPGSGARYLAHRDNEAIRPSVYQNSREVTAILYINPDWKEGDGGELCAYLGAKSNDQDGDSATEKRIVEPKAGRLLLFDSKTLLHEVLPAKKSRFALTMWMVNESLEVDANFLQQQFDADD